MDGLTAALVAAAAGAALTEGGVRGAAAVLRGPRHVRENYRGRPVVATAGVALAPPLAAGGAVGMLVHGADAAPVLLAGALTVALLGFVDDVYGTHRARGLAGHARELLKGRVTTGAVKAAGGAAVGLASAWALGHRGWLVVVAGAVVALSANLANLLDLRPARTAKAWLPAAAALLAVGLPADARPAVAALAAGVLVFALHELGERVMLGDTGAGLLGGAAGIAAVASSGSAAIVVIAAVLLGLTLLSEAVSFTRAIEAVPPLRWLDRLGRRSG